jgi:hypothetical protein
VNQGNYEAWMSVKLCDKRTNDLSIFKTVVNVSKIGDKQVVKAKASVSSNNIKVRLNMEIRASATKEEKANGGIPLGSNLTVFGVAPSIYA